MTPAEEDDLILRNASTAREAGAITTEQERDVWVIVMTSQAERGEKCAAKKANV